MHFLIKIIDALSIKIYIRSFEKCNENSSYRKWGFELLKREMRLKFPKNLLKRKIKMKPSVKKKRKIETDLCE